MLKLMGTIEVVSYDTNLVFEDDNLFDEYCYRIESKIDSPSGGFEVVALGQSKAYPSCKIRFEPDYVMYDEEENVFVYCGFLHITDMKLGALNGLSDELELTLIYRTMDMLSEVGFLDVFNTRFEACGIRVPCGDKPYRVRTRQDMDMTLLGVGELCDQSDDNIEFVPLQWKFFGINDLFVNE